MDSDSLAVDGFQNLPIERLEYVKNQLSKSGMKTRIRYRGPRRRVKADDRYATRQRSECLKEHATHFSVYLR